MSKKLNQKCYSLPILTAMLALSISCDGQTNEVNENGHSPANSSQARISNDNPGPATNLPLPKTANTGTNPPDSNAVASPTPKPVAPIKNPSEQTNASPVNTQTEEKRLDDYVGTYRFEDDSVVTISIVNNKLFIDAGEFGKDSLKEVATDRFSSVKLESQFTFVREKTRVVAIETVFEGEKVTGKKVK